MIVLRKCPAWKGFAILGDENSTISFFLPLDGSEGSTRPRFELKPYEGPFLSIAGMTSCVSGCVLKKKEIEMPFATGFSTSGDSGNCLRSLVARPRVTYYGQL